MMNNATRSLHPVGTELFQRISQIIPVLPVSVVATAMVESSLTQIDSEALATLAREVLARFEQRQAVIIKDDQQSIEDFIQDGVDVLIIRRVLEQSDNQLYLREDHLELLKYIYNSTAHLLNND